MKKVFLSAFLLLGIVTAQAQEVFKPKAGDIGLEVLFNPLAGVALNSTNSSLNTFALNNFTSQFPYLKGRFFIADQLALRAGFRFGVQSTSNPGVLNDPITKDDNTTSVVSFAFLPGIEKHFAGTERLSPYIGAELALGLVAASSNSELVSGGNSIKTVYTGTTGNTSSSTRSSFSFGLNAVAGADYYFIKRAYLGIEAGFGLNYVSYSEIKREISGTGFDTQTTTTDAASSSFNLFPSAVGALRLGFWF